MKLYLDASVLLVRLNGEEPRDEVRHALAVDGARLLVSSFAAGEVASGIARLVRMDLISRADGAERLAAFDIWTANRCVTLRLEDSDVRTATTFVRTFDHSLRMPDAIHLALCRRIDARLLSLDRRLVDAAASLGIEALQPG